MIKFEEFVTVIDEVNSFYDRHPHYVQQRRALADKTKPNPVTKVAERLATEDEVSARIGGRIQWAGLQLLETIHAEVEDAKPAWQKSYEEQQAEEEARIEDRKNIAHTVNP